jgi:hypothetical protein
MSVKIAAGFASIGLALATLGCMDFYEVPVQVPIQAKLDVSMFKRVLVAGFLSGGSRAIDPNTETARLLRSQLRTKSSRSPTRSTGAVRALPSLPWRAPRPTSRRSRR